MRALLGYVAILIVCLALIAGCNAGGVWLLEHCG